MARNKEPLVEVWGLEDLDPGSRRLRRFDFSPGQDGSLSAYPVFTDRFTALAFADMLTEDAEGPDAEEFRRLTRDRIRRIDPREIPRASKVMINCTALRDPGDNVASVFMSWGAVLDDLRAQLN